jgi:diacylglycerol kinase family enzyme
MAGVTTDPVERLEAAFDISEDTPRKRMLIIVNPYATTVSDRLKNLVVYALRGSYHVEAIDTETRNHATELCREAAREGYDAVVAFGGDGTVNEAANGLVGSRTALGCIPGGRTNVYCRILGIPNDVVDATEHLLQMADRWNTRRVDVGTAGDRKFLFSAGVGLDASVVEQVDAHPHLKARFGEWYYTVIALRTFNRHYLLRPPRLEVSIQDERLPGVSAFVQNAAPYTFFGHRSVDIGEGAALDSGDLSAAVLGRATPASVPTLTWRALSRRARVAAHRQIRAFSGLSNIQVRSLDERPLPLEVDGDYIGDVAEVSFGVLPAALSVIA